MTGKAAGNPAKEKERAGGQELKDQQGFAEEEFIPKGGTRDHPGWLAATSDKMEELGSAAKGVNEVVEKKKDHQNSAGEVELKEPFLRKPSS